MNKNIIFLFLLFIGLFSFNTGICQSNDLFRIKYKNNNPEAGGGRPSSYSKKYTAFRAGALSLPIVNRLQGSTQTEVNFLNAAVGGAYVKGHTDFFTDGNNNSSSNTIFYGGGLLLGAQNVALNKQNDTASKLPSPYNDPGIIYGAFGIYSIWSMEFIVSIGFETATGNYSKAWINDNKPYLGFGLGFNLFNISLKSQSPSGSGPGGAR